MLRGSGLPHMKILHISSESSWRGGEQQLAYLLEELQQLGISLFIACQQNSAFEAYCKKKSLPYALLPFRNSVDIGSALQLKRLCEQEKIDLVHVHSSRGHSIAYLAHLFGTKLPLLLTRRVAFPISGNRLNLLRYNSSQLQKIICVSEAVKESTAPILQDKGRLAVVYDGIDLGRFADTSAFPSVHEELGLPATTPLIGTVAALTAEKDLTTFVRVAGKLKTILPHAHFVVIGDGPEKESLKALAQQLGVANAVHFLGRRNNVPQLLPQLNVFLFTSQMEGLGTSVLDAFACKIPVVATAAGGIPEMVLHEKTGLLTPVGDTDSLAKAVLRLTSDQELRQKLSNNAYALLLKKFTKDRMATETVRVYQKVFANTHAK